MPIARWPCPSADHPGVSTLYLEHPSWQAAAESLGHKGKRFLTPSGKVEIVTPELQAKLAPAGHAALPPFYAHPEVTGGLPSVRHSTCTETSVRLTLTWAVPNPLVLVVGWDRHSCKIPNARVVLSRVSSHN